MTESTAIPSAKDVSSAADYRRFIILGGARVGSHMLASSLNSSRQIICFREVLNAMMDYIQYGVDGYDESSKEDLALRENDPAAFLRERVFSQHDASVRAVGFKFHYAHVMGLDGAVRHLLNDSDLHVIHLRRKNVLRMFVSWKLARQTGTWLKEGPQYTQSRLQKVLRDPSIVLRRVRRLFKREPSLTPPQRITIDTDELFQFAVSTAMNADHFDQIFAEHPKLNVLYEDILDSRVDTHAAVQRFLGVRPKKLAVNTKQQHPMPLRDLISNYEEVRARFQDHPAIMLDD